MELSPAVTKPNQQFAAECRCPPMKAQSAKDGKCYDLYSIGPCEKGYYFAPDTKYNSNNNSKRTWGVCTQTKTCKNHNEVFWPKDSRCYMKLTRGPCPKGQLIVLSEDKIAECKCNRMKELRDFRYVDNNCYQHFTKGPCREKGQLFLPDRTCGCHSFLPHFHDETELCFEIGSIGPCSTGEDYQLHPETRRGMCQCKIGYIRHLDGAQCYRPFTQGPCKHGYILRNTTTCMVQPCARGHLFFPEQEKCYRIGTPGPCAHPQLVTFDFETRPSVDGISYNGVCSCAKCHNHQFSSSTTSLLKCNKSDGMVRYRQRCYKLYAQGPCPKGAWIVPRRNHRTLEIWSEPRSENEGLCECIPGYTRTVRTLRNITEMMCTSPTVILAEYLNRNYSTGYAAQIITL